MKVRKATGPEDIEALRGVAIEWRRTCCGEAFGLEVDVDTHLAELNELIVSEGKDLLLLSDGETVVGYMGICKFRNPLGQQFIANEQYWYVLEGRRGKGSVLLLHAGRTWAKEHGCTHLLMNASKLASKLHDSVCRLYERMGMLRFETSFIQEIT